MPGDGASVPLMAVRTASAFFYPDREYNFRWIRATSASTFAKGSAQAVFSLF
ncbi:hypothetical protein SATMO3_48450 [Sporomusa aerivorans]